MNKKFFPVLLFVMVFTAVVAGSIGYDLIKEKKYKITSKYEYYNRLFDRPLLKGKGDIRFSLRDLRTEIVIVNFWASWCSACALEHPALVELRKKFDQSELEIVSINSDEINDAVKAKKIISKYKFNFPVIYDFDKEIQKSFKVESYPFSVVYINGIAVEVHRGLKNFNSNDTIEAFQNYLKNIKR